MVKVRELIERLEKLDPEKKLIFSTDEEGNHLYAEVDIELVNEISGFYYRMYVTKGMEFHL